MQVSGKRSLGGSWDGPLYSAHDCDHCRGRSPTTMTTISTLHRWLVNHVLHHTHHLVYAKAGTAASATRIHLIIMSGILFTLKMGLWPGACRSTPVSVCSVLQWFFLNYQQWAADPFRFLEIISTSHPILRGCMLRCRHHGMLGEGHIAVFCFLLWGNMQDHLTTCWIEVEQ